MKTSEILIRMFLLLAIIVLLALFMMGSNIEEEKNIISDDCLESIECESNCMQFYTERSNNHFLECRYICMTLKNCD